MSILSSGFRGVSAMEQYDLRRTDLNIALHDSTYLNGSSYRRWERAWGNVDNCFNTSLESAVAIYTAAMSRGSTPAQWRAVARLRNWLSSSCSPRSACSSRLTSARATTRTTCSWLPTVLAVALARCSCPSSSNTTSVKWSRTVVSPTLAM